MWENDAMCLQRFLVDAFGSRWVRWNYGFAIFTRFRGVSYLRCTCLGILVCWSFAFGPAISFVRFTMLVGLLGLFQMLPGHGRLLVWQGAFWRSVESIFSFLNWSRMISPMLRNSKVRWAVVSQKKSAEATFSQGRASRCKILKTPCLSFCCNLNFRMNTFCRAQLANAALAHGLQVCWGSGKGRFSVLIANASAMAGQWFVVFGSAWLFVFKGSDEWWVDYVIKGD